MSALTDRLSARFPPEAISWRVGSTTKDKSKGLPLAYVDARDVMDRLDEVCGPEGWQCRYTHVGEIIVCEIGIRCGTDWVWKANGAGQTDIEGEKGGCSDAFKRAAVLWGVGRYLYGLKAPWVDLEPAGNSYKIATKAYPTLVHLLRKDAAEPGEKVPMGNGIVKLKAAMRQFKLDLSAVEDEGGLAGLLHSYKAILDECAKKLPVWYYGDGGDIQGAERAISDKKQELRSV